MNHSGRGRRSKIARLIEEYELRGLGEELEERWTRSDNRSGLRQLAGYVNRELCKAVLAQNGVNPLEGETENTYRLLTDEDVSSGVRTQTRNQLEQQGIDVEKLEGDFVSKQAIHTYLTKYREAEPPDDNSTATERRDRKINTIDRLRQRLINVTERSLEDLFNTDSIHIGDYNVVVTIRIHCRDCETRYSARELFTAGSCECEP